MTVNKSYYSLHKELCDAYGLETLLTRKEVEERRVERMVRGVELCVLAAREEEAETAAATATATVATVATAALSRDTLVRHFACSKSKLSESKRHRKAPFTAPPPAPVAPPPRREGYSQLGPG